MKFYWFTALYMIRQSGRKIQRFVYLFTKNLFGISLKNMENNISLTNDLNKTSHKSDNTCLTKQDDGEIILSKIPNKRYFNDYVKKSKKYKKDTNRTRRGYTDEKFEETSYYFDNGLRKVYPYYFTFTTYTKGRWVGKTLFEVFSEEFRAYSTDEYKQHIEKGLITINNEHVSPEYVLKHNDLMANVVHRHEVPVTSDKIDIIHIDEDIVVINKPASIPVHPCGRYRHNTIVFLLAKEYNLKDLKTLHRLDRLTSGVLIFGRTLIKTQQLEAQIRNREIKKEYVCRVDGKFPDSAECNEPIFIVSHKIGVCKVSPNGKKCHTLFQLIGYNEKSNTSIVTCTPYSGRMHQIRVHLQFLGYPIKNDPLYNDTIFGPEKGRGGVFGKSDAQLINDLIRAHSAENWLNTEDMLPEDNVDMSNNSQQIETNNDCSITEPKVDIQDNMHMDKNKFTLDPFCKECLISYKDPKPKDLIMYLHAYKYSGPNWSYKTPMPIWADVDWVEPSI